MVVYALLVLGYEKKPAKGRYTKHLVTKRGQQYMQKRLIVRLVCFLSTGLRLKFAELSGAGRLEIKPLLRDNLSHRIYRLHSTLLMDNLI